MKAKVLFVAEAVTLSHVVRPWMLASALPSDAFDIMFAANGQFAVCPVRENWQALSLNSIAPAVFMDRLAKGKPVYTEAELLAYVKADLALLSEHRPDAVVGDFRLSLSIAARLAGVPFLAIVNAHWSPFVGRQQLSAPDLAIAKWLGFPVLDLVFRAVWPFASRLHCTAINRVRASYGLRPYARLSEYYCDADLVMYADPPSLATLTDLPLNHKFIGPVVWSPSMALPEWWAELSRLDKPIAYINLGSTGSVELLPRIVDVCQAEGYVCLLASAGRMDLSNLPGAVFSADYLPGSEAARLASVAICNGGATATQQALAEGCPVVGICSNLDQVLTMDGVRRRGVGLGFRAGEFSEVLLREVLAQLRSSAVLRPQLETLKVECAQWDSGEHFHSLLRQVLNR